MTAARKDKFCLLREARLDSNVEALGLNDRALSLGQHLLASNFHLFDSAIKEFKELAV